MDWKAWSEKYKKEAENWIFGDYFGENSLIKCEDVKNCHENE